MQLYRGLDHPLFNVFMDPTLDNEGKYSFVQNSLKAQPLEKILADLIRPGRNYQVPLVMSVLSGDLRLVQSLFIYQEIITKNNYDPIELSIQTTTPSINQDIEECLLRPFTAFAATPLEQKFVLYGNIALGQAFLLQKFDIVHHLTTLGYNLNAAKKMLWFYSNFIDDHDIITTMINKGYNINTPQDGSNMTALHYAAQMQNSSLTRLLLSKNAYPNVTDNEESIPLFLAVKSLIYPSYNTNVLFTKKINTIIALMLFSNLWHTDNYSLNLSHYLELLKTNQPCSYDKLMTSLKKYQTKYNLNFYLPELK